MTLDKKFEQYHRDNPQIYDLFVKFTKEARNAGFKHYSIRAIVNRVRWHIDIETRDPDGFKINHNYTSRYARMIMDKNPNLAGIFKTRELKS